MVNLNVNGNEESSRLLGELVSQDRKIQSDRSRKLENEKRQAEIHNINAQTRVEIAREGREVASIEVDIAQAELIRAQARKTNAEAQQLEARTLRENIMFALELMEKMPDINIDDKLRRISTSIIEFNKK